MSEVSTIFKVWGDRNGWVRLPRKLRSSTSPKGPKNNSGTWEEKMFQWPDQSTDIREWIQDSHKNNYDLYWSPCLFTAPRGLKDNVKSMNCLYADLDNIRPHDLPQDLRPTICIESSPGRYAGVWMLDREIPSSEFETLNRRLTYFIGADKGGWDLTQVLRIPGMRNHKYEGAPASKLLWYEDKPLPPSVFGSLPDTEVPDLNPQEPDELFDSTPQTLPQLVKPYLSKLPAKVLELLFASDDDTLMTDRSERLWELECKLLESGIPEPEVVSLVAASSWNKYKGRRDETRRITVEVQKAAARITVNVPQDRMAKRWTSYSDLMGKTLDQPGWMIEGVWQRTSHGMIAGEPKTYKSVIATDMAVSVASGKPFLGKYAVHHQGPVMYIQEENSPWLVQDRVMKIATSRGALYGKADLKGTKLHIEFPQDLPLYFLNNMGFDFTSTEDQQFLEESIKDIKPVMIIFDPLYLMLGGKDENSAKDIRPVLNWLLHLRYDYKTSIVLLHHWNKAGKSERGGQRMLGSVLWHGWVESAMYTSVVNEQKHQIAVDREFRSFSKPEKLDMTFTFGDPGDPSYKVELGDHVDDSEDAFIQLLSQYRLTEDEIKEALGISKAQVLARLKMLIKSGKVAKDGNCYYALQEEDDE